jgi:hypothetical protein
MHASPTKNPKYHKIVNDQAGMAKMSDLVFRQEKLNYAATGKLVQYRSHDNAYPLLGLGS